MHLEPFGSVFVVFRSPGDHGKSRMEAMGHPSVPVEIGRIEGPWRVQLPEGWGAPTSRVFPKLISWTKDDDEGVKYFSGVATYRNHFDLTAGQLGTGKRLWLDLGRVRFVAEAYINGRSVGTLWHPPFRVDITDAVRAGRNELVVEVVNTWSNRLVGDARSEGRDYCRTNIARSLTWQVPWKETPLLESGLLGPVRLMTTSE